MQAIGCHMKCLCQELQNMHVCWITEDGQLHRLLFCVNFGEHYNLHQFHYSPSKCWAWMAHSQFVFHWLEMISSQCFSEYVKHLFSVWNKSCSQSANFDEISHKSCLILYAVFIHEKKDLWWPMIKRKFKFINHAQIQVLKRLNLEKMQVFYCWI